MQSFIFFKFLECGGDFFDRWLRVMECEIGTDRNKRGIKANQEFVSDFINLRFAFDRFKLASDGKHLVGKWNDTDGRIMREQVDTLVKVHSGGWHVFLMFGFEGSPCFSSRFDLND